MEKGSPEVGEALQLPPPSGLNIGISISILDVVLRVVVLLGTLISAVAMATIDETLFTSQFTLFTVEYDDLPALSFFVIANSVVCAYLAFSIPLAIYHIMRRRATYSRLILIFFDTVMLGLLIAGASAASAIVYLANWPTTSASGFLNF